MDAKRIRQYFGLVGANLANVVINFASVLVLTRILSEGDFGAYRYIVTFFTMVAIFAQLGIPYAASVLLTRIHDERQTRRTITMTALTMVAVSAGAALLIGATVGVCRLAHVDLNPALTLAFPFVFVSILQVAWIEMLKGANKIADISAQTLVPYALILLSSLVVFFGLHRHLPLAGILVIHVSAYTLIHLVTFLRLHESAAGQWRAFTGSLAVSVRRIGAHVYVGSLFGVASAQVLALVLGHVIGMTAFGTFGLALSMSTPVQMIPAVMGTVLFKENARGRRLGPRSTAVTVAMTLVALAVYLVVLKLVFPVLFPPAYVAASTYTVFLAFAYALFGLGDYFNRFIGAHGHGRYLMIGSIATGTTNVIVTVALIATGHGIMGAIIGSICAAAVYLGTMLGFYRRVVALGQDDSPRPRM